MGGCVDPGEHARPSAPAPETLLQLGARADGGVGDREGGRRSPGPVVSGFCASHPVPLVEPSRLQARVGAWSKYQGVGQSSWLTWPPLEKTSVPAAGEGGKGELSEVPSEILQDLGSRQEPSRAMGGDWTWSRRGLSEPRLCGSLAPVTSAMGTTPPVAGHPGCERAGFPWRPGCLRLGPGLRRVVLLYPDNIWGLRLLLASHAGPHLPILPLVSKRLSALLWIYSLL